MNSITDFTKKVLIMSNAGSKTLMLTAKEAKALETEIVMLLTELNALKSVNSKGNSSVQVDAGKF